jgi:hypothetical protein
MKCDPHTCHYVRYTGLLKYCANIAVQLLDVNRIVVPILYKNHYCAKRRVEFFFSCRFPSIKVSSLLGRQIYMYVGELVKTIELFDA